MRIGINVRMFNKNQHTGIARSVYEVLKVWINEEEKENEYFLFSNDLINLDLNLPENWHFVEKKCFINKGILWDEFTLPQLIKENEIDVFWGTNFSLPRRINGVKYIVTIYDLAAFKIKGITEKNNLIKLKLNAKKACKRADKIISISNATSKDIHELFNVPNNKITTSYCGGLNIKSFNEKYNIASIRKELLFDEEFFLFIGTIEPRKNIVTIIKAFEQYKRNTNSDMKLVLAGKIGWLCDEILETIKGSKYTNEIIVPGFINEDERVYLYMHAKVFLFPSLYEGFGLPILEAYEYKLPVITSNISSMPEVGGDAAFYLKNVKSSDELYSLMKEATNMSKEEKEIRDNKMNIQKKKFSWEKNAHEILNVFVKD